MAYDPSIHHGRSVRIQGWEHYTDGIYFVTICIFGHLGILGEVVNEQVALSAFGRLVERSLVAIPDHAPGAVVNCRVIMPNHIHAIIALSPELRRGTACRASTPAAVEGFSHPVCGSLATIVRSYKAAVTHEARGSLGWIGPFWQCGFYEHVIRDPGDSGRIAEYILSNPPQWTRDHLRPPTAAEMHRRSAKTSLHGGDHDSAS